MGRAVIPVSRTGGANARQRVSCVMSRMEDMAPDEIEAAVEKARGKLAELLRTAATGGDVRIFAKLPDAAERFRRQITLPLDGNRVESAKARELLRGTLGDIRLELGDAGSLWASYELRPGELIRGAVTSGRGERI
ncbi:MAG: hypothetical protein JWL65_4481 [Gammaproteobacteria bacterium]|nr:hypothetical protein [Gammaproteobacteria bacterium]